MLIKFSPEFLIYTSGLSTVKVYGKNISEALSDLFNRFPLLQLFLTENNSAEANKTSLTLNGEFIFEESSIWWAVSDEDVLEFGREIPEGENAGVRIIVGAVMIALAIPTGGASLGFWATLGMGIGVSLVLGGLTELITGTPTVSNPDGSTSANDPYSYSGIRNSTEPGTPIPIVYGTHRVAGHLTAAYVEMVGDSNQYLQAQLGLSEGEIEFISHIEINKRAAEGFLDIQARWRKGTDGQEVPDDMLLGFDSIDTAAPAVSPFSTPQVLLTLVSGSAYNYTPLTIPNVPSGTTQIVVEGLSEVDSIASVYVAGRISTFSIVLKDHLTGAVLSAAQPFTAAAPYSGSVKKSFTTQPFILTSAAPTLIDIHASNAWGVVSKIAVTKYTLTDTSTLKSQDPDPYMVGFGGVQNTTSYSLNIGFGATEAVVSTQIEANTVHIGVTAPALYAGSATTGAVVHTGVEYKIFRKDYGAADNTYVAVKNTDVGPDQLIWTLKAPSAMKSEYTKVARIVITDGALRRHTFKLERVTALSTSLFVSEDIFVSSVTEVAPGGQIYPHTALLGIRLLASTQVNGGLPTITSLVKGIKVAVPNTYSGSLRTHITPGNSGALDTVNKQWTDNPVWCLYDLITNTRYGLGEYFKIAPEKTAAMLTNFNVMADYCDVILTEDGTVVPSLFDLTTDQVAAIGFRNSTEHRYRFSLDLVIDESKTAIEWLNTICAIMRATLYYTEGCVYIDIDRSKNITQLFTMHSIKDYTQTRGSLRSTPNTYELQFVDAANRYEPQILIVEDSVMQQGTDIERRSKTLQLRGVTNGYQARSLAKYVLYAGKYAKTSVSFKTGTQGLRSMVGDVVGIQHDVPEWGVGGKITAINGNDISISCPLVFEESTLHVPYSYAMVIQKAGTAPSPQCAIVAQVVSAIEYSTLTLVSPPAGIAVGDEYVIGLTTNVVKPFRIVNIKRDSDELVELTAVEYVESLYDAADDISTTGGVSSPLYQQPDEPTPVSVTNLTATVEYTADAAGTFKPVVTVNYTVPNALNWDGVIISYSSDKVKVFLPPSSTGTATIYDLLEGEYTLVACSQYKGTLLGKQQSEAEAKAAGASVIFTIGDPTTSTAFSSGVRGLAVVPYTPDNSFIGKDCKVTWYKPLALSEAAVTAAGEVAGTTTVDTWFRNYQVEIRSVSYLSDDVNKDTPIDGPVKRTFVQAVEGFTYTHEMNRLDGAISRTIKITVRVADILGRTSAPKSIICSNPAPDFITYW